MTTISVKLTGAENIQIGLNKLGAALPGLANTDVEEAMNLAKHEASGYWAGGNSYAIPELPNQGYIRTGVYARSMYVEQDGRAFRLQSEAPYSVYVGGDAQGQGQAWMHKGRWPVIADVVRKWAETLTGTIDRRIKEAAEAFGL